MSPGADQMPSPAGTFDLEAYMRRIGYVPPSATGDQLSTLRAIVAAHTRAIAFENLDAFLGRPVNLDPASLQSKLVAGRRGGWCFEQNLLLTGALVALGYRTSGLGARVLWNRPEGDAMPARGHMLVRVDLEEGPHLVDVGFGGLTLTGVLRLEPEVEQSTPHEPFRLWPVEEDFLLQAKVRGTWSTLYRFGLERQHQSDYELTSWYLSHHPTSHFVTGLIAARTADDRRIALRGRELSVHHLHGPTERRELASPARILAVLEADFLLDLTALTGLEAALTRLW